MELNMVRSTWFHALRAWLRDWGGILTISSTVYMLFYLLTLYFQWIDASSIKLLGGAILPVALVTIVLCWRASSQTALDERTRQAWRILAIAFLASWLGNALFWYYSLTSDKPPFPSLADPIFLAHYPLLLWGILTFPAAPQSRSERVTFWLDAGMVLVGSGMVLWYLVLQPTVIFVMADFDTWLSAVISIAYPAAGIVLIFGIAVIAFRKTIDTSRVALTFLLLYCIFNTIANIGFGYLSLQGAYRIATWPDAVWMLAALLIVFSAHTQYWAATHYGPEELLHPPTPYTVRGLPYVALTLGYGLLLLSSTHEWATPLGSVIFGSVALSGLVVARQLTASRAMQRARADAEAARAALEQANAALDERVRERTATLEAALAAQEAQARALQESLATQEQLSQTIAALSVPIIPIQNDVLVTPLIGAIDSQRATLLLETVLERVQATHARQVFLDVTGVAVIDTQVARMLLQTATALRLLGAEAVLVGIRPEVAHTLVTLGVDFSQLRTAATLQAGLEARDGHKGHGLMTNGRSG